jgi:glucosamine--fructose-6-phosphate aminotransferase (isomerizing)
VGITADHEALANAIDYLVNGLKRLEYRGYDSAGFGFIECRTGRLIVLKDKGKIDEVVEKYNVTSYCGVAGIAHTRWATHGAPNKANAHPHVDCSGKVAVVHNGIIKNFVELREFLEERGHVFKSDTDTEVIAHLFEEFLKTERDPFEAFKKTISMLEGAYAIVLLYADQPLRLYFARKVSPLIIGVGRGFNIVSSDIPSILPLTRNIIALRDDEYGYIEPYMVYIEYKGQKTSWRQRITTVTWSVEDAEKAGYPHFMLKEIMEQPRVLYETFTGLTSSNEVYDAARLINEADYVFVTGAGTSYHAGLVFAYYMSRLARTPVIPFISSEYKSYESLASEKAVLIAVSQSGETIDTLQALRAFKAKGARIIAVSNVIASTIPRESDSVVYTRAGPEIGVAATKTFLTQVLALTMMAMQLANMRGYISDGEYKDMVELLSRAGRVAGEGINASTREVERLVDALKKKHSIYVLGRGLGVPLAYEAALKIKEVSYIHAEAYPAGESKHGPIALIEKGFPVIFVGAEPGEDYLEMIQGNILEMKARGAFTIVVGHDAYTKLEGVDYAIGIGEQPVILAPYAIIPPLQLLAYKLAVSLGYDPDKPRNLAKTVTVE